MAELARTGEVTVDVAELEALEVAGRAYGHRASVARQARDFAAQNLGVLVEDLGDVVIQDHLSPALDVVVADMKTAVDKCGDAELSDRAMLSAATSARDGWLALDDTRTKYALIRSVRAALVRTADADRNDTTGIFAEVRNAEELWPEVGSNASHTALRPEKAPGTTPMRSCGS